MSTGLLSEEGGRNHPAGAMRLNLRVTRETEAIAQSFHDPQRAEMERCLRTEFLSAIDRMAAADPDEARRLAAAGAVDLRRRVERFTEPGSRHGLIGYRAACAIHDTTLQLLEYIASDAYGAGLDRGSLAELIDEARASIINVISGLGVEPQCRSILRELRRIVAAACRRGDADIRLVIARMDGSIDATQAAALVGATREALTNSRKHSGARTVTVHCEVHGGQGRVSVVDDGCGLPAGRLPARVGVRDSIKARMEAVGGAAALATLPSGGVRVTLTVPGRDTATA